jgi:hypothetical protein
MEPHSPAHHKGGASCMLTFAPVMLWKIRGEPRDVVQGLPWVCRGCGNDYTLNPSGLCNGCETERAWGRRCGRCGTYLGPTGRRRCACDRRNNRGVIA